MKRSITDQIKSSFIRGLTPTLLATAILSLGAVTACAGGGNEGNPGILPPQSHPYGKTYAEWSAAWWQWAYSIPAPSDPITDQTGQNATVNQSGNVWFLAGNMGGTTERTVTVPSGKALFIPILNTTYLGFPCDDRNLPGCESDQALEQANDVATLLSFIAPSMDGVTLACKIDGIPVRHLPEYRTQSSVWYAVTMVDNNVYGNLFGIPGGAYHPCVDDGYFLMLAPLNAGRHTIHFTGANAYGFSVDVTYHLTVLKDRHEGRGDCHHD
jgi:hypothetical protein